MTVFVVIEMQQCIKPGEDNANMQTLVKSGYLKLHCGQWFSDETAWLCFSITDEK